MGQIHREARVFITIRCTYPPHLGSEPSEVSFRLSPAHGCETAEEAHALIRRLWEPEEYFELQPDSEGEPLPFWSETVREFWTR